MNDFAMEGIEGAIGAEELFAVDVRIRWSVGEGDARSRPGLLNASVLRRDIDLNIE